MIFKVVYFSDNVVSCACLSDKVVCFCDDAVCLSHDEVCFSHDVVCLSDMMLHVYI